MSSVGVLVPDHDCRGRLEYLLKGKHSLISKRSVEEFTGYLHNQILTCIIIQICENGVKRLAKVPMLKKQFSMIPIIGLMDKQDLELARLCGQKGIDRLITVDSLDHVDREIDSLMDEFHIRVRLEDFNLDFSRISKSVEDALKFMEKNYIELEGVAEISSVLGVSESSLSREFRNNQLIGPKRMLLYFKLKHAIMLMSNNALSIKEITFQSGFSSAKRFNDSFQRIMGCSPGSYRTTNTIQ